MNIRPGVKMFFIFSITFLILSVEKVTANSDCSTAVASGSYNGVNACSNSQQNQLVKLINEVSFLLPGKRVESTIDICDDLKVMGKVSAATTVSASTINCDYSFVVLIIVNINGTNTTMGMGVVSDNCTIITTFENIYRSKEVWVKFKNNETFLVICYEAITTPSLTANIFLVKLTLALNSWNCTYKKPSYSPGKLLSEGYIISRRNCDSTVYDVIFTHATLVFIQNDLNVVVASNGDDVCQNFGGSVFIDYNGKVNGIFYRRPSTVFTIILSVPVVGQVNFRCILNLAFPGLCL